MTSSRPLTTDTARPAGHTSQLLLILGCALGLFLNHSTVVEGVNVSIADALLVILVFALAAQRRLIIPPFVIMFFLAVLAISGVTATVLTPVLFGVDAGPAVISDILKMLVSFGYLICGIGVAMAGIHMSVLRWFAIGASAVALLGIVIEVVGIPALRATMYYGGARYRGFMVDPNYWAVLACAAIAFLARDTKMRLAIRLPMILSLIVSVLLSASKTGLITMSVLLAVLAIDSARKSRLRVEIALIFVGVGIVVTAAWGTIAQAVNGLVDQYVEAFPQLQRVSLLIEDPIGAISEGGSGRADTWASGLTMVERSPFLGVGIGSYRAVNGSLFGETTVAHNTYLQLAAEWGLPLAILFLGWMVVLLVRATNITGDDVVANDGLVVRNMVIAFLIGSFSLSLNNARMFWLFVGVLIYLVYQQRWGEQGRVKPRDAGTAPQWTTS
ncbi:O-antigen ligase family protein [uncultured Microbacterium sp.]|uniref:O-antigen ligase family protein n=1 Tax=uncultured Microbacterium sp. TaxID=191216 RepID=UPI0028E6684F|nr:O-antigen ligase family protein [uncultured Microbacterium sp.]